MKANIGRKKQKIKKMDKPAVPKPNLFWTIVALLKLKSFTFSTLVFLYMLYIQIDLNKILIMKT